MKDSAYKIPKATFCPFNCFRFTVRGSHFGHNNICYDTNMAKSMSNAKEVRYC